MGYHRMRKFIGLLLLVSSLASAYEQGAPNQVLRVPPGGGRPQYGGVDLSQSGVSVGNQLKVPNGGTGAASLTANGVLVGAGTGPVTATAQGNAYYPLRGNPAGGAPIFMNAEGPIIEENIGLTATVAANALTITLTTSSGGVPSASDIVRLGFRSQTVNGNTYSVAVSNSSLGTTLVVPSGATLGGGNSAAQYLYVYGMNQGGTIELAVSGSSFVDTVALQSTTAISAGSTDGTVLYAANARTNDPIRLIARLLINEPTAGTWTVAPSEISVGPHVRPPFEEITITDNTNSPVGSPVQNTWYLPDAAWTIKITPGKWLMGAAGMFNCATSSGALGNTIIGTANLSTSLTPGLGLIPQCRFQGGAVMNAGAASSNYSAFGNDCIYTATQTTNIYVHVNPVQPFTTPTGSITTFQLLLNSTAGVLHALRLDK